MTSTCPHFFGFLDPLPFCLTLVTDLHYNIQATSVTLSAVGGPPSPHPPRALYVYAPFHWMPPSPPSSHLIVNLEVGEVRDGLRPVDQLPQHLLLRRLVVKVVDEDGPAAASAVLVGSRRRRGVRLEAALRDALRLDDALDRHRVPAATAERIYTTVSIDVIQDEQIAFMNTDFPTYSDTLGNF